MSTENKYQFKGTQGEWLFVKTQMIGRSIDESDFNIAVWDNSEGRYDTFVNCWNERCNIGFDTNKEQASANAHLIAAAPELLQACVDHEDNTVPLSEDLRELAKIIDPKETHWVSWLGRQADIIDAALNKALNIQD